MRAYDPTIGRFLSRDPLGRAPLIGWSDQPYVYAGNNSLVNVDPSGQRFAVERGGGVQAPAHRAAPTRARTAQPRKAAGAHPQARRGQAADQVEHLAGRPTAGQITRARDIAKLGGKKFSDLAWLVGITGLLLGLAAAAVGALIFFNAPNPVMWGFTLKLSVLAGVLFLLGAALGVLTAVAARVSTIFYDESDPAKTPDSWWSSDNVLGMYTDILKMLVAISGVEVLIGAAIALVGQFGGPEFVALTLFALALVNLVGLNEKTYGVIRDELSALSS